MKLTLPKLSETSLILLVGLYIIGLLNLRFFQNIAEAFNPEYILPAILIGALHLGLLLLGLLLLGTGTLLRWLLAAVIVISASSAYFIDTYNVIIDSDMLDNTLKTDPAEVRDLLSLAQAFYIIVLGILPAWLVIKVPPKPSRLVTKLSQRLMVMLAVGGVMAIVVFSSADFYASYLREHKILRYYSNPLAPVYGAYRFAEDQVNADANTELQIIAPDAKRKAGPKPKLTVIVAGETLRAVNFGLNGYERNTTPLLAQRSNLINFTDVSACGTSTALSLPCMFSYMKREEFDKQEARYQENVLDILAKTGVEVLWLDNNSSSKGVADRVTYIDSKTRNTNPVCDTECRDVGMIQQANEWLLSSMSSDDKLVVLHQMGNHGPAYFKRYPSEFEIYSDTCKSNQLDSCSRQSIINAYDNTAIYTDYFLDETIKWLEQLQDKYDVAMLYVSDHGESLGENGLYLHGYPYMFAPKEQIEVPMVLWASTGHDSVNLNTVMLNANNSLSHDNLFHTVLGLHGVDTDVYQPELDILR